MLIECTTCPVRGRRCDDCVVTTLAAFPVDLPSPSTAGLALDAAERRVVELFVAAGLVDVHEAVGLRARREPRVQQAVG